MKREILEFLRRNDPSYADILRRGLEHERENASNPHYLGWAWHEVQAYPARLVKLVVNGVTKVGFKSNSTTCYRLVDPQATEQALMELGSRP